MDKIWQNNCKLKKNGGGDLKEILTLDMRRILQKYTDKIWQTKGKLKKNGRYKVYTD